MKSRIYVVGDNQMKVERLVRGNGQGQVLRHVFSARIATQDDLERLMLRGVPVEQARMPMPDPALPIELPDDFGPVV